MYFLKYYLWISMNILFIKLSNYLHNNSLCVVCVHMYDGVLCVCGYMCVCAYVEVEGQLWVLLLLDPPPPNLGSDRICHWLEFAD